MELTASQDQAVRARGPALQILACAGSGKTEVLARRVVRYLLRGTPPEGIVAFTFTEKAARELKTRIETRAAEADQRYSTLPPCAAGLFVGTIHSYCLHLLQKLGGTYELSDPLPEEREWALLQRFARRLGIVSLFEQTWPGRPGRPSAGAREASWPSTAWHCKGCRSSSRLPRTSGPEGRTV